MPAVPAGRGARTRPGPIKASGTLVLRSSKRVYKAPAVGPLFRLGSSPDPGPGAGVELGSGHLGGVSDLVGVGELLPGEGGLAEDPPPAFLQVEPAGALGDEGVADAGMVLQPGPGAFAVVAGEVIGDHVDRALGVGLLLQLEEVLVGGAVAGKSAHGNLLPVPDAHPAVDPALVRAGAILPRRLARVGVRRPAQSGQKGPRNHRAELIGADHRGAGRRGSVELHD